MAIEVYIIHLNVFAVVRWETSLVMATDSESAVHRGGGGYAVLIVYVFVFLCMCMCQ